METTETGLVEQSDTPRSLVSLDHNGPSIRVLCIGNGNMVVPAGAVDEDGNARPINHSFVSRLSFGMFALSFACGLSLGVWTNVLMDWIVARGW